MAARSSWTGTISLGVMAIPVTLGKATRDERESSIVQLCGCHHLPIDRKERCETSGELGPVKVRGVKLGDGTYQAIPETEWAEVEDATKDDALEIIDAQPLSELPMAFSTGTYFIRPKKDDRAAAKALAKLVAGLGKTRYGAVVKLSTAAKQELAVISCYQGYALLTLIPFFANFQAPGAPERAHMKVTVAERDVETVASMLHEMATPEFKWESFENNGLKLRQQLADRYLAEEPTEAPDHDEAPDVAPDLMAQLLASVEAANRHKEMVA